MDYLYLIVHSLLYIMPAYIANASAVLFRGKARLDMGARFLDGKPVLGRNKTIEGFLGGAVIGSVYALFQSVLIKEFLPVTGVLLAFGAMVGDSIGSFIKRRLNLKSGELAPFLDQWDFVLGGFLFVYIGGLLGLGSSLPSLTEALLILIMTVVIALVSNLVAYVLKLKNVPW